MQSDQSIDLPSAIDPNWRVGIVHSMFYKEEIQILVDGAEKLLSEVNVQCSLYPVAGSFEVPLIGASLAHHQSVDALIGLGIIVEGETHHARLLAEQSARGIMDVQLRYCMPFAFEILYVHSLEQARERTQGNGNKGREAAISVLHSLAHLSA